MPITVDWFAKTKGDPWTRDQVGTQIAQQIIDGAAPVGVMLHHAFTNLEHLALIDQLFTLVARHPSAVSTSIYNSSF